MKFNFFLISYHQCPGSYRCPVNKSEGALAPYIIHADKNKQKIEKSLSSYENIVPFRQQGKKSPIDSWLN